MSAKTSPARRAAFMAAVAETGNRTLAAERARVSQSWVTLHRAADPAFRAELDAAIATAKARLRGDAGDWAPDQVRGNRGSMRPPVGWRSIHGEELVVRGGNGRRTQIARARLRQWTPRVEARFLSALAACCNVKAACAAVGLSQASAYNHYRRWPLFAEQWEAALGTGYARIEAALVERAGNPFAASGFEPDLPMPRVTFDEALQLLRLHQQRVHGVGNAPGSIGRAPDPDTIRASILKRVERFERTMRRDGVDAAADTRAVERGARIVREG